MNSKNEKNSGEEIEFQGEDCITEALKALRDVMNTTKDEKVRLEAAKALLKATGFTS